MKKIFYLWLMCAGMLVMVSNCTKDDKNDDKDVNGESCENTLSEKTDSIVVHGCSDFSFNLNTGNNVKYIFFFKEKKQFDIKSFSPALIRIGQGALRSSGWYEDATIVKSYGDDIWNCKVEATGEYIVKIVPLHKLIRTPDNLPVSYTEKGAYVVGPFNVTGNTTFKLICSDAKGAGVSYRLWKSDENDPSLYEFSEYNLDENNSLINNFSKTKNVDLTSGPYYMEVIANSAAEWTVEIQ